MGPALIAVSGLAALNLGTAGLLVARYASIYRLLRGTEGVLPRHVLLIVVAVKLVTISLLVSLWLAPLGWLLVCLGIGETLMLVHSIMLLGYERRRYERMAALWALAKKEES